MLTRSDEIDVASDSNLPHRASLKFAELAPPGAHLSPPLRALFVLPDVGSPRAKGYQVRCLAMAAGLSERYVTRVVASRRSPGVEHLAADARPLSRLRALIDRCRDGRPLQSALFDGLDVANRVETLARSWKADVVVVVTERLPLTVLALRTRTVVVDVVDSMRLHMSERSARSRFPSRLIWRHEERAFARLALELREQAMSVVASSATALTEYPDAIIIQNAADEDLRPRPEPTVDVLFTGTLSYWPNVAAAIELCSAIAPRIRSQLPTARIVVAGRNPTAAVRAACARASVELMADVVDMAALLRTSRLALVPLSWTPAANLKVLEALASGTPVLAYRAAVEHLPPGIAGVIQCDDAKAMSETAVALLTGSARSPRPVRTAHTWKARAAELESVLDDAVARSRARRAVSDAYL